MSDCPLVTIGLPVYNTERYLRRSLDSLLAQTFTNFQLIISDNASTDGTARVCEEYAATDARIRYCRNASNIGNPRNFNRIADLTTTRYLKWSTADDYWAPEFVERAVEVMERDPTITLCYPRATIVDADGLNPVEYRDVLHLMGDDPSQRFLHIIDRIGLAHQHLGLIRMSDLRKTPLLGTHVGSDINLLAELSLYGKFFELPQSLFFRRLHEDSGSWRRGDREHEARRYHAAGAPRARLTRWPAHMGFLSAVRRSPLPARERARLYTELVRRMVWDRRSLAMEVGRRINDVVRRPFPLRDHPAR